MSEEAEHVLEGLEPDNLLAFLALLGLLRALDAVRPEWRARAFWRVEPPVRPVLTLAAPQSREAIAEAAAEGAATLAAIHDFDRKDLAYDAGEARQIFEDLDPDVSTEELFRKEELFGALMSDGAARDDGRVWPTPLCFLFGQGHQHFLERLADVPKGKLPGALAKLRDPPDLNAPSYIANALFAPWTRGDSTDSFRWDPAEDRRYALRACDPSSDPGGTQHGANRLAGVGLPVLSGTAIRRRNEIRFLVRGATYGEGGRIDISWPIWTRPARLAGLRALLAHPEIGAKEPNMSVLSLLGVACVRRARRISVGKYFNVASAT
jgi:hypothetical protein